MNDAPRASADIQLAILAALANGPLFADQIRQVLQVYDGQVLRELQALRDDGLVKAISHGTKRRYALKAWQAPFMAGLPRAIPPKAEAPTSSWWVGKDRAAFTEAAAARARARAWRSS